MECPNCGSEDISVDLASGSGNCDTIFVDLVCDECGETVETSVEYDRAE